MAQNVYFDLPGVHRAAQQAQATGSQLEEAQRQRGEQEAMRNAYAEAAQGAIGPDGTLDENKLNANLGRILAGSGNVKGYMDFRRTNIAEQKANAPDPKVLEFVVNNRATVAQGLLQLANERGFDAARGLYQSAIRPKLISMERNAGYGASEQEIPQDIQSVEELQMMAQQLKQAKGQIYDFLQTSGGWSVGDKTTGAIRPAIEEGTGVRPMPIGASVDLAGAKKGATERAEAGVKKEVGYPKARATFNAANRQWDYVGKQIDSAIEKVSPFTAGAGAWASVIPASPQKDLKETLETIKANIGFDKLAEMRANSPTGGALGQVSDFENKLLQAVQGSLVQNQSPAQLRANLQRVKDMLQQVREERSLAFEQDYQGIHKPLKPAGAAAPGAAPAGAQRKQGKDNNWYVNDGTGWKLDPNQGAQ